MSSFSRVCVFCGSQPGARPAYAAAARAMAEAIVAGGAELVYGGGHVGLMGMVADAAMAAGGRVIGVIPEDMAGREVAHHGIDDLRVVASMHERKAMMYDLSDAFVALPGGIGTMEELFEVTTWCALGLQAKPVGLLDVDGFYEHLVAFLDHATTEGLIKGVHRQVLVVRDDPAELLAALAAFEPPPLPRWLRAESR
jgi:uncharacterized protein (TIGR00730 family)